MQGRCLVDYEIRELIAQGNIANPLASISPWQIQPSSFEPTLGTDIYSLMMDKQSLVRPQLDASLDTIVKSLSPRHKQQHALDHGYLVQAGHTYLLPLQETMTLKDNQWVKFSPRSSSGRLFLRTRVLADYNDCYDEAHPTEHIPDRPLRLWLLLQSQRFNIILRPGQSLVQARILEGDDAQLSDSELRALAQQQPLLYHATLQAIPVHHIIAEGLQVHLDLEGLGNHSIVGLRARPTLEALDLSKKGHYQPHDFFEPIPAPEQYEPLLIDPTGAYLLCSKEVIAIPTTTSAELQANTHISSDGMWHLAGFFDPGFHAQGVYEFVPAEHGRSIPLYDGMPVTRFRFYRNNEPHAAYGTGTRQSQYQRQMGPKLPKQFQPVDYRTLAHSLE